MKYIVPGFFVGMGAATYLVIPDKVVGSLIFSMGIILCTLYSKLLITRVVPVGVFTDSLSPKDVVCSLFGNIFGAAFLAFLLSMTRVAYKLEEPVAKVIEAKVQDDVLSIFILSILCAFLVGFASITYMKTGNMWLMVLFIGSFVIMGYEHIVANGFYFGFNFFHNGIMDLATIKVLAVSAVGNIVGGLILGWFAKGSAINSYQPIK